MSNRYYFLFSFIALVFMVVSLELFLNNKKLERKLEGKKETTNAHHLSATRTLNTRRQIYNPLITVDSQEDCQKANGTWLDSDRCYKGYLDIVTFPQGIVQTVRGTVLQVNSANITLKTDNGDQVFDLVKTSFVSKVGQTGSGNSPSQYSYSLGDRSDLKHGQKVFLDHVDQVVIEIRIITSGVNLIFPTNTPMK